MEPEGKKSDELIRYPEDSKQYESPSLLTYRLVFVATRCPYNHYPQDVIAMLLSFLHNCGAFS